MDLPPIESPKPGRRPRARRRAAAGIAIIIIAAACGSNPSTTTISATTVTSASTTTDADITTTSGVTTTVAPPLPGTGVLACQISDFGGTDDASINQSAWAGMERAALELGVTTAFLPSNDTANYSRNIETFIEQGCDLIVTTGPLLAYDTATAAREHPDQLFAIIDYPVGAFDPWGEPPVDNVRGLTFQSDEAAFLAGYLAAGMSATHVLGTFGGVNIPPVTIYMEGFRQGALHYDGVHGTTTTLEGWNGIDGLFTADFTSQDKSHDFAQDLIHARADIILPVAERAGEGACRAAAEANATGGTVSVIGIHWDWYLSAPDCSGILLTSILKNFDVAVFKTIQNVVVVSALGSEYVGTLENGGVGLAPFHDFESAVPAELVAELTQLQADIISGAVLVNPPTGG